jgi:hypothetical protein
MGSINQTRLELRTLVAFFEIVIPDPRNSFSVASHNELTGFFFKSAL